MTPVELHKLHSQIKILGFRDLASLLKLLTKQKRLQLKYLIENKHLNLTCDEEYMNKEEIYNATETKIRRIKFRMRNIIRQANKPTKEF